MQGFGVQTKNINDLIKQIEQEIAFIKKNLDKDIVQLNNKLVNCITDLNNLKQAFNDLKDYTEEEYSRVKGQIQDFEAEIEEIRNNLIQVEYRSVGSETVAVGPEKHIQSMPSMQRRIVKVKNSVKHIYKRKIQYLQRVLCI